MVRKVIAIVFLFIIIIDFYICFRYDNKASLILFWNELFNLSDADYTSNIGFIDGIFNAITAISRSITESVMRGLAEWILKFSDDGILRGLWGIIVIFFKYGLLFPIKLIGKFFYFLFIEGATFSYYVGYILTSIILGIVSYFYFDE